MSLDLNSSGDTTSVSVKEIELIVGEKFSSYEELQNFLSKYYRQERQMFVVGSSKSLTNSRVKRMAQEFRTELRYHAINYVCKFAGSPNSEAKGFRKTSSCKMGCEAFITVGVTGDGNFLEIKNFRSDHTGHEGSEAFFELLPQSKKLGKEKDEVLKLVNLGCDAKTIQDKLVDEFDKHLSRKDIANLASQLKGKDEDSLKEAVKILEQYGANVKVLHESNEFKALYFSTKKMTNAMSTWPEIVFIDGTYKLLKNNLTLMLLIVEDSIGLSRVVGAALLAKEDRVTFQWFLENFREDNQVACQKMQCMMGDKDLLERDVLKEIFPKIPIYICLFHVLRTFGRTISKEDMDITSEERQVSLRYLDRLAKSLSEEKYNYLYEEFCRSVPLSVQNYFNKNWHPIREEWTKYSMTHGNLGNHTNNRLESMNAKIKLAIKKRSTMVKFVHSFFKWYNNREKEMLNKLGKNFLKKPVTIYAKDSAEQQYTNYLTTYAFTLVLEELNRHTTITIRRCDATTSECFINAHDITLRVTPRHCQCSTSTSMLLPCRHIFAVRRRFQLSLFVPELCAERWTRAYAFRTETDIQLERPQVEVTAPLPPTTTISRAILKKPQSDSQKQKIVSSLTTEILHTAMLSFHGNFDYKVQVLQEILGYWKEGYEVSVSKIELSEGENSHDNNFLETDQYSGSACASEIQSPESPVLMDNTNCTTIERGIEKLAISLDQTVADPTKDLADINLPVSTRLKHPSKYAGKTTIKMPKRKKRPIKFASMTDVEKAKKILGWIVIDQNIIASALSGEYMIPVNDIESRPESLCDSIANYEDVELDIVKPYLTEEAFAVLTAAVKQKVENDVWICTPCGERIRGKSVLCESCLKWYHTKCVPRVKKNADWFCGDCKYIEGKSFYQGTRKFPTVEM